MSKKFVKLSLRDMYAIKHSLQLKINNRKMFLPFTRAVANLNQNKPILDKVEKDIEHEEALIKRFEREIEEFREKNNIK